MYKYMNMSIEELKYLGDPKLKELEAEIIAIFNHIMQSDYSEDIYREYIEALDDLYTRIDYALSIEYM